MVTGFDMDVLRAQQEQVRATNRLAQAIEKLVNQLEREEKEREGERARQELRDHREYRKRTGIRDDDD